MRRVRFDLRDRLDLIPVELVSLLLPTVVSAVLLLAAFGFLASGAAVAAVLAGTVGFAILLPWIPTPHFSTKGMILGGVAALPFGVASAFGAGAAQPAWWRIGHGLVYILCVAPVSAYLALNFTGSTTFTSKTGVRKEIFKYIPVMAWMLGVGVMLGIVLAIVKR
jgi:hypothetical protein